MFCCVRKVLSTDSSVSSVYRIDRASAYLCAEHTAEYLIILYN